MATKMKKTSLQRKEVESLTGTITGKKYHVVLDDVAHGDTWDPSILPALQADGIGKVNIIDGVTEFAFKDSHGSTIQFAAKAGGLMVDKFFALELVEVNEDDSAAESV